MGLFPLAVPFGRLVLEALQSQVEAHLVELHSVEARLLLLSTQAWAQLRRSAVLMLVYLQLAWVLERRAGLRPVLSAAASGVAVGWRPWGRVDGAAAAHGGDGGHVDGVRDGDDGAVVARLVAANLVEVVVWLGTGSSGEGSLGAVLALDGMELAGRPRCVDPAKTMSRELVVVLVVLDAGSGPWIRGAGALVSTCMRLSELDHVRCLRRILSPEYRHRSQRPCPGRSSACAQAPASKLRHLGS